jgi:tetratricopeptide (TPR) repeat protein
LTQYQPDEKNRIKRQKSDLSVRLAKEGRWDEAVQVNRDLLAIFPDDTETLNRLGKALMELKRYAEAKEAYEHSVKQDPTNTIAQKNLKNLQQLVQVAASKPAAATPPNPSRTRVAPSLFIEETGKTGVVNLVSLASSLVLARLTAGDRVYLEVDAAKELVRVKNEDGEVLGQLEPRMNVRLFRFIQAGNRYVAAVQAVSDKMLRIVIQEIYQHPSQRGKMSFPPKSGGAGYRAYIKEGVRERYGADDEDYDNEGEDYDNEGEAEEGEEESEITDDFGEPDETEEI